MLLTIASRTRGLSLENCWPILKPLYILVSTEQHKPLLCSTKGLPATGESKTPYGWGALVFYWHYLCLLFILAARSSYKCRHNVPWLGVLDAFRSTPNNYTGPIMEVYMSCYNISPEDLRTDPRTLSCETRVNIFMRNGTIHLSVRQGIFFCLDRSHQRYRQFYGGKISYINVYRP